MSDTRKTVSSHPPPTSPWVGALAALTLGVMIAFVIAEVGLRVFQPIPIRVRGDEILLPRNVVYNIHNGAPRGLGGALDENLVHTKNSLGFRGPEPPADFDNDLTIVAIGGSTTECFYLSDADAWPQRLAVRLSGQFRSLWLNNAGLDGHSTFGHLQLMRQYISQLHPKFVTILAGINDMFAEAPNNYDKRPIASALSNLARYSDVAALALMFWRHQEAVEIRDLGAMPRPINLHDDIYHTPIAPSARADALALEAKEKESVDAYRRRLVELVNLARSNGIEPILITQPALFGPAVDDVTGVDLGKMTIELGATMSGSTAWTALEAYNEMTRAVGREKAVPVVDLAHLMPKSSRYYYDFLHFSKAGAMEVATILDREMCPILADKAPRYVAGKCPAP